MEKYINEVGEGDKQFILLVNKADYLSEELIAHWNQYFREKNIEHIFFSALEEQTKIDEGELDEPDQDSESEGEDGQKKEGDEQGSAEDQDDDDDEDDEEIK